MVIELCILYKIHSFLQYEKDLIALQISCSVYMNMVLGQKGLPQTIMELQEVISIPESSSGIFIDESKASDIKKWKGMISGVHLIIG